jgi:SAM-dependent methyltransferase
VVTLRTDDGETLRLEPSRWHADADALEEQLLTNVTAPVLDVGCGPGRLLSTLGRRGIPALGIDPAPSAVTLAGRRGGSVLRRSVFDRVPGEGRWGTVVLLDGNIGIGGDAVRLLQRCRTLISSEGTILVELEPPGHGWCTRRVRLEQGDARGPWFDWAVVGADAIDDVAEAAGLQVVRLLQDGGRWFAKLGWSCAAA